MISSHSIILLGTTALSLIYLGACSPSYRGTGETDQPFAGASHETDAIGGEIVVQGRASDSNLVTILESSVLKLVGGRSPRSFSITAVDQDNGIFMLSGAALKGHEKDLIQALGQSREIEWAERNFRVQLNRDAPSGRPEPPRDAKWLNLWGLANYGQDSPQGTEGTPGADIKALEAWKTTTGSRSIVVAVLDTGIDYTHPDLAPNAWINEKEANGTPGVDDDGNGYTDDVYGWDFVSPVRDSLSHGQMGDPDPMDDHGHGTHVAGTIGAAGNNGIGIAGINWQVRLMALKFLSAQGSGTTVDQYRAIRYAIAQGVDVINASYGSGARTRLIEKALKEAGKAGILLVAAAGNDGSSNDERPHYPSDYSRILRESPDAVDSVLSVAATDNRDHLAGFSNYGFESVDIAAPGVGITSTFPVALAEQERAAGSGDQDALPYRSWSGTSMATPHVAGAAALVLAAHPSLRKNPAELKKRLLESVEWRPQLAGRVLSGGRLHLANAVTGKRGDSPMAGAMDESAWVEEAFTLRTPRFPTERIDQAWKIHKPGAKALRVHLRESFIDSGFDVAMLYDALFRPITTLPSMAHDYWLPAVQGDTIYLKFSNAQVSIRKFAGEQKVEDPSLLKPSASPICFKMSGDPLWTCLVFEESKPPFMNFSSEGIEIDRIRYIR